MVWKFLRKSLYLPLVSTFLSIMLTLALVGMIIYIIAENQHPVQTLAWVLVIIFLPRGGSRAVFPDRSSSEPQATHTH